MLRALLIAGVLARAAAAQNEEAHTREAEQSVIALVTIGPGPHLNQRFGHTALLVANRATGQRELYDYGNFVSSRATWRNVLSGRPLAFAYAQDARAEFRRLATAGRSVELQWLALGTAGKLELLRALARDLRHSTREYLYDYRVNNCTTKIRDLIDRAADGALRRAGQKTDSLTFRERARRDAVLGVVADFVAELGNAEVDRPVTMWDAAANRTALATLVDHTQLKSTPFVDSSSVSVPESSPWTSARAPSTRRMLAAGCACALVLVALALFSGRLAVVTVAAASGSAGLALGAAGMLLAIALLGGYSFAESNVNFLLVNPLTFVAGVAGLFATFELRAFRLARRLWHFLATLAVIAVALATCSLTTQVNTRVAALAAPMILGCAAAIEIVHRIRLHRFVQKNVHLLDP